MGGMSNSVILSEAKNLLRCSGVAQQGTKAWQIPRSPGGHSERSEEPAEEKHFA